VQVGPILAAGGWLAVGRNGDTAHRFAKTLKRSVWTRIPPRLRNRIWRHLPPDIARKASKSARRMTIDWEKTTAFPLGNEPDGIGVWINADPPFSKGIVKAVEYDRVRGALISYLTGIRDPDSGELVFARVARREEIYVGLAVAAAPDLVLVPRDGYGAGEGKDFIGPMARVAAGGHRQEGVYLSSHDLGLAATERIETVLPAVLRSMGFSSATDDSQRSGAPIGLASGDGAGYDQQEVAEIEERLRDLGYIE
jgi:predicted AlkP superfamily phosphohydrolase/phosphomutase